VQKELDAVCIALVMLLIAVFDWLSMSELINHL
jgi:hypothetical protein